MNEPKDKALRKALKQEEDMPRLSPNFCFRTLQRIDELARLHERQAERRQLAAITLAAMLLAGGGLFVLLHFFRENLRQAFALLWETGRNADFGPALFFALPVLILLVFDYVMRRAYYSRRKKA